MKLIETMAPQTHFLDLDGSTLRQQHTRSMAALTFVNSASLREKISRFLRCRHKIILRPVSWLWKIFKFLRLECHGTMHAENLSSCALLLWGPKLQILSLYSQNVTTFMDLYQLKQSTHDDDRNIHMESRVKNRTRSRPLMEDHPCSVLGWGWHCQPTTVRNHSIIRPTSIGR